MADEFHLVSFDEDSYYQDPAGFFEWLRESRPVAPVRMPDGRGRAWFITRDADVRAALADPRLANDVHHWPGGARQRPSEAAGGVHAHLLNTDPPVHTRLRRLVWKAFTPRRVARLRPRAEEIAAGLLDEMAAAGGVTDLIDVYARPLPGTVLCELLGVPEADRGRISAAVTDYDKPGEADRVTRELARLRADPSLLPAAVEELLRFTNPLNHATDRFTTQDTTVGDVVIPAGEWVFMAISSANRDPGRFPDPDRLDLSRDTSGHLAFGHGIHYCLGASLARVEAEVALGALLARFPGLSLAVPPEELRWRPVSLMNGLESLPVRLA